MGVDHYTAKFIATKFELLNDKYPYVVIDFIEKSKKMGVDFSKAKIQMLSRDDGVICSPNEHLIVFENPFVRILWGSTMPGAREPFHVHAWKSLLVVLKPTTYEMEYPNGNVEILACEIGVYELPANEHYACTNIGAEADEILRFEVK